MRIPAEYLFYVKCQFLFKYALKALSKRRPSKCKFIILRFLELDFEIQSHLDYVVDLLCEIFEQEMDMLSLYQL